MAPPWCCTDEGTTMEAMTSVLDDREWTREERDQLPDDGNRYELIDGALVVTPSPKLPHQRGVGRLYSLLAAACPEHLEVFVAPLDITIDAQTVVQPDVLVARVDQLSDRDVMGAPVLAVEVLSPSTQVVDRNLKLDRYERAETPAYWLLDPERRRLQAYEHDGTRFRLVADVCGDEDWTATVPFTVTITPGDLFAT